MSIILYSQGRGAFKDKTELRTSSKYTLRHIESRVKVDKRLREESKDDKSMINCNTLGYNLLLK